MVGAHLEDSQPEILGIAREIVAIEQHLLGPVDRAAAPARDRILPALLGAAQIPVGALAGGHAEVGLLDSGLDLLKERLPQVGEMAQLLLGVRVLGPQVGEDLYALALAHPVVGIDHGLAVQAARNRLLRGYGCVGGCVGHRRSLPESASCGQDGVEF